MGNVRSLIPRLVQRWAVTSDEGVFYIHRAQDVRSQPPPRLRLPVKRSMRSSQAHHSRLCAYGNSGDATESRWPIEMPSRYEELTMKNTNSPQTSRRCHDNRMHLLRVVCVICIAVGYPVLAAEQRDHLGVAGGESTQQSGQQGLGLEDAGSSNVVLGGPEIIIGSIQKIHGENYTISGDHGQQIQIRVTADTNRVCTSNGQGKVSSGQEGVPEQAEIPPTPFMERQKSSGEQADSVETQRLNDQQDLKRHAESLPSTDPSEMKERMGSTDSRANEDVARGSGFVVGECLFKKGDHVRVEASDMGTATTIKQLAKTRKGLDK
ncbi:MAG: hypothetical protein KF693_00295 [Nitrospira sp.]|nr:hypothetical protein [Nitrospira sp.]